MTGFMTGLGCPSGLEKSRRLHEPMHQRTCSSRLQRDAPKASLSPAGRVAQRLQGQGVQRVSREPESAHAVNCGGSPVFNADCGCKRGKKGLDCYQVMCVYKTLSINACRAGNPPTGSSPEKVKK